MMDYTSLLEISFVYGLILSVALGALFFGGSLFNRELMLRSYPPDIKQRYGAVSMQTRRLRRLMSIPLALILFGTIGFALAEVANRGYELSFAVTFATSFLVFFTFNLVDLLIFDWLIFVGMQPKFAVLPGTEGLAGYRDYLFHFKGFLKGTVLCALTALIVATIVLVLL
jgi:hypothetical protein